MLLVIGKRKVCYDYKLNGTSICFHDNVRDLGFVIQHDLKFRKHCNRLIRNAYFTLRNIFNTFKGHDCDFYLHLYFVYVRSILESASQVWAPSQVELIDAIEKVQGFFTR